VFVLIGDVGHAMLVEEFVHGLSALSSMKLWSDHNEIIVLVFVHCWFESCWLHDASREGEIFKDGCTIVACQAAASQLLGENCVASPCFSLPGFVFSQCCCTP
jgi:hypothetical protein